MSWLLAFLGFAALIVLHEFGHFLAAKAVGMRVEKFSLFFGPMLAKFQRGETTYGVASIPLGGYVKITGMNPHEEIPPEVAHRAYFRQPVWKRIVVIAAGPFVNIVIAFVLIWGLMVFHGLGSNEPTRAVGEVERATPAAGVLERGDRILAVDGVTNINRLSDQVNSHTCEGAPTANCKATTPAVFRIERNGQVRTLEITPLYDEMTRRNRVGFGFEPTFVTVPPGQAVGETLDRMWFVTSESAKAIARIFYDSEARKQVSGVVGSYDRTRESIELSADRAIWILALISLSLAVINLFPFLPLDGGHIFWALAEKVRGRPIPFAVMERAGIIGFGLVAILFVIGLTNDIGRLTNEGFQAR